MTIKHKSCYSPIYTILHIFYTKSILMKSNNNQEKAEIVCQESNIEGLNFLLVNFPLMRRPISTAFAALELEFHSNLQQPKSTYESHHPAN